MSRVKKKQLAKNILVEKDNALIDIQKRNSTEIWCSSLQEFHFGEKQKQIFESS